MAERVYDPGGGNSSIPKDGQTNQSGDSRIDQVILRSWYNVAWSSPTRSDMYVYGLVIVKILPVYVHT